MITVFGLGFVGLTTALGFAHFDKLVYGIDTDEERVALLKNNELPFLETNMDIALAKYNNHNFIITDDISIAVKNSEFIFYCVGTPYGENGDADLRYLFTALESTIKYLDKEKPKTLVIKSTIPPSTTKQKIIPFIEQHGLIVGKDVFVANNPEFLREGYCWEDFVHADRIVIGTEYEDAAKGLLKLYEPFEVPVLTVSSNTGEFIKYLSNTLLATLISYSNEMADVADHIGDIEVAKAFRVLHMDKRWDGCKMTSYVYPGCGYGGYCLPKDTNALYATAKQYGIDPKILGETIRRNESMAETIAKRIASQVTPDKTVGILGLSFKPESNDVRDCASAKIIQCLQSLGYHKFAAYDPCATEEFKKYYDIEMKYCESLNETCKEADTLVILTAWNEFKDIDKKTNKPILDYRYML